MKWILLTLLLFAPLPDIDKIARTNELKKEAKAAIEAGKYKEAIKKYHYLLDSMNVDEESIRMNLANAYYQVDDTTGAILNYELLRDSKDNALASRAYQQLGIIKNKQKKMEEALAYFKQALRKDPSNEEARYNYEILKKLLDEQKEQQKQDQNQDQQQNQDQNKDQQQNQDQQQQDQDQQQKEDQQQDKEGKEEQEENQEQKEGDKQDQQNQEQSDEQESDEKKKDGQPDEPTDEESDDQQQQDQMSTPSQRFKDLKISEEKAKMILEAMKNQEVQYLQQNRRKSQQPPPSDKPDW